MSQSEALNIDDQKKKKRERKRDTEIIDWRDKIKKRVIQMLFLGNLEGVPIRNPIIRRTDSGW